MIGDMKPMLDAFNGGGFSPYQIEKGGKALILSPTDFREGGLRRKGGESLWL